jgi:aspartate aminotransferase-like enzyme
MATGSANGWSAAAPRWIICAAGAVESALAAGRYDIVALVHAESASGILNPLPQIAALAKTHGALLVVDAVASVGGHELDVDGLGIDIAVIGPQKSLGGSAGISALSVSETAWERILAPGLVRQSILSLADLKLNWLDQGRGALPGMPSSLELQALDAALARIESEGLEHVIARHQRAADATRAAIAALGLPAFTDAASASNLTTGALLPAGITVDAAVEKLAPFGVGIAPSIGAAAKRLLRINHTGNRARFEPVLANVMALGAALHQLGHAADLAAAGGAVLDRYGREAP